jgi:dTDP-4-amino-4,6-dideoxygalactose transaminase
MSGNARNIPIARPWLDQNEARAADRAILSGWVTQGPEVAAFEKEFAACVDASFACAVSSCTAALHVALMALGVQPGDEIITVSHSFIATANSIRYCGAIPVFIDIDPATFNMRTDAIETAITRSTRAILCVHQVGMPCDLEAILRIAERHSLPVIEDAACAIGTEILCHGRWQKIGKPHGTISCFSFHPRKVITTGDGGMLTTSDAELDRKFRLFRQHGMSIPDTVRHSSDQIMFEEYAEIGYNYRMTDIQAAIGREQLKKLPEILLRRRELAARYRKLLESIPGIIAPIEPPYARSNWQSYCVRLAEGLAQKEIMQFMLDHGVSTRRGVMCSHREPAYAASPGSWRCSRNCAAGAGIDAACADEVPGPTGSYAACDCLRESERAQDQTIVLPLYSQMGDGDQSRVVDVLRSAVVAQRDRLFLSPV